MFATKVATWSIFPTRILGMRNIQNKVLAEIQRRQGILNACFDKQRAPIDSALAGTKQIAILTSRRAGKTNTVLRAMCRDALEHPNCRYAYIGLSRVTAETIVWKELEAIDDAHNLQLDMQGYRLRAIFPNGSEITLYGADQPGWAKKFKGAKYRGVAIDEAGEYDIDLQDFIFRVMRPCLSDLQGTLWLIGTPGIVPSGYWWAVTNPDPSKRVKGWELYQWHTFDNPYLAEQFRTDMEELREIYGDQLDDLPWYRREWLGQWSFDTSNNVYKYQPERNDLEDFGDYFNPHQPDINDQFVLAVDPGLTDAAGFVVGLYNPRKHDKLIFLECYREVGMSLEDIADRCELYMKKYPGLRLIGDPDAAHFMQLMRESRGINIEDAQKTKKADNIGYFNNGLLSGRILMKMPECAAYAQEAMSLTKQYRDSHTHEEGGKKVGEWKENPKQPNDLCDCGLYINRIANPYTFQEPANKPDYGSPEYYQQIEDKLYQSALNRGNKDPWWRKI